MKKKKRITVHDIARLAGASSATVSRVLSNSSYPVSSELKDKIRKIAEEHHYIPNRVGQQLKTLNNYTIGVIIPTISNPFYASVMLGIEEIAQQNGYQVFLCNSKQNPELEDGYLKTLFENQVEGVIVSSISANKKLLTHLMDLGLKVVAVDQHLNIKEVQQIEFNYRKGGYLATKHLIDHGHRDIAYITAPLDRPSRKSIYQGYLDALSEAGLETKDAMIQIADKESSLYDEIYEFNNGKQLARKLLQLDALPTAVFACNDLTAIGAIQEFTTQGITVPEDISVVGFDNIEFGQMVMPALTTVNQPNYEMGRLACNLMLDMIKGETVPDIEIVLQPKLIERKSVKTALTK